MHNLLAVLLLATASQPNVSIAMTSPITPALAQRRDALSASLAPTVKLKLQSVATSLRSSKTITDGTSRAAVQSAFPGVSFSESDITALTFVVLMEATQSTQKDVQAVVDNVSAVNKQKESLRNDLAKTHAAVTPRVSKVQIAALPIGAFKLPPPLPPNASIADKQKRLDDLDDLGEGESFKLQELMDRRSQLAQMLSNTLKKVADTNSAVIRNLK